MQEPCTPPSRSFRLVCRPEQRFLVEALLAEQAFRFETEDFFPPARRLVEEPLPLGASLASVFGYIYIQDRSSMLPPLALNPPAGAAVLDMCASPGSKTSLLAQLVGEQGFVLANEPNPRRLASLRQNLLRLNLLQTASCSYPGEQLPLPSASWDYILLDPPCSAWGTADKDPKVLKLWKGSKLRPLVQLQRRLLTEAARLLAPGGRLVYSTCTTNIEENEEQLRFALDKLALTLLPLGPFAGFSFEESSRDLEGCLRIRGHAHGAQGFFLALLTNKGPDEAPRQAAAPKAALAIHRQRVPLTSLQEDTGYRLPPGESVLFGPRIYFLPQPGLDRLPRELCWQGCMLGKVHAGQARLSPRLHRLMPPDAGRDSLNLDSCAPLVDLLAGRALAASSQGKELLLYWRGLPLARLSIRGHRALLSP